MAVRRRGPARLDVLWRRAREPLFLIGPDGRLLDVNPAWEELTGFRAEEVRGQVCGQHGPDSGEIDAASACARFAPPAEALAGRPAECRTRIVHPSGASVWKRLEFRPHHDSDEGRMLAILGRVLEPEALTAPTSADSLRQRVELMEMRERLLRRRLPESLVGQGPAHRRILEQVQAAAAVSSPVLIVGGPGTGKRHLARAIHQAGSRRASPLLAFDLAALPADVLERELFGTESDRWRLPAGASALVRDVLDLPRDVQARLARVLAADQGESVRLIGLTQADPEAARVEGRLREDLYYPLTSLVIRLAPLRDRLEELPILAQFFLERANRRGERQRVGFTPEALDALAAYDWPGNLRELARVVDRAHEQGESDLVGVDNLPKAILGNMGAAYVPAQRPATQSPAPLDQVLVEVERGLIEHALTRARRNKSRAADLLGISRPRLYRRMQELGIEDETGEPRDGPDPNLESKSV